MKNKLFQGYIMPIDQVCPARAMSSSSPASRCRRACAFASDIIVAWSASSGLSGKFHLLVVRPSRIIKYPITTCDIHVRVQSIRSYCLNPPTGYPWSAACSLRTAASPSRRFACASSAFWSFSDCADLEPRQYPSMYIEVEKKK